LITASKERLSLCPGVGAKKVQRLHEAFNQPFLVRKKPRLAEVEPAESPGAQGHSSNTDSLGASSSRQEIDDTKEKE
jgi:hypothetical protein